MTLPLRLLIIIPFMAELLYYHQLFDIYNDYEGIANLKTVNDNAGIAPVEVDPEIIALLTDCKDYYDLSGGVVNVAMGSVLQLWHVARNDGINDPANAYLPQQDKLTEAAQHMDFAKETWYEVIENTVPPKTIDINKKAFEVGYSL